MFLPAGNYIQPVPVHNKGHSILVGPAKFDDDSSSQEAWQQTRGKGGQSGTCFQSESKSLEESGDQSLSTRPHACRPKPSPFQRDPGIG